MVDVFLPGVRVVRSVFLQARQACAAGRFLSG